MPGILMRYIFHIILVISVFQFVSSGLACASDEPDFTVLVGEWVRPDGGYLIRIEKIHPNGSIDAGYFNPGDIHVAEANVSEWKGLAKLFIKLEDKGYPGSTYTLYYYAEKDALAGFYHQASINKTFEVVFIRKE